MYEAARERPPTVTPSFLEEKIELIEMLATMSLAFVIGVLDVTEFDEPAGSPNSLVVCWISFPKSIVLNKKTNQVMGKVSKLDFVTSTGCCSVAVAGC